jgi:hypothetical protein
MIMFTGHICHCRYKNDRTLNMLKKSQKIKTNKIQQGLTLRRFVLQWFTFTTLIKSDRALPTCSASLFQLKRHFSTFCVSSSFPMWVCFLFFNFSVVPLRWLWFFHPWCPSKRQKRRKNQNSWRYILSWCLLNHSLGLLQQNKKLFDFFNSLN